MAEGGTSRPDVIEVPNEDPEDFLDLGPQNPAEAQSYWDKIDHIMDTFRKMLENNRKDVLYSTVLLLKKLMAKHWHVMAEADTETVMKSIHDPGCVFLRQHLTLEGVDILEPWAAIPIAWEFIRQLPEKKWKTEIRELILQPLTISQKPTPICHLMPPTCPHWQRLQIPIHFSLFWRPQHDLSSKLIYQNASWIWWWNHSHRLQQRNGWRSWRRSCSCVLVQLAWKESQGTALWDYLQWPCGWDWSTSTSTVAWPRKLVRIFQSGTSSCPSYCLEKSTWMAQQQNGQTQKKDQSLIWRKRRACEHSLLLKKEMMMMTVMTTMGPNKEWKIGPTRSQTCHTWKETDHETTTPFTSFIII